MRTIGACAVACDPALVNKKTPTYSRGYLQALRNRVKASSSPFAVPSTECSRGGGERAVRSPSSRPPSCASTRGRSSCPLHSRSNAAMRTSYAWSKDKDVHPWDTPLECEGLVCDVGDLLPIPPGYDGSSAHGSQAVDRDASPAEMAGSGRRRAFRKKRQVGAAGPNWPRSRAPAPHRENTICSID